jgi:hypothetical protein
MQAKRGTVGLVVVGLMVMFGSVWRTASLRAADPPGERGQKFGMFGLVAGQTARLNLVYADPPTELVPAVCPAELQFFDSEGRAIGRAAFDITGGQARYLDLRREPGVGAGRPGLADPPTERQQIRASWRFADPPGEHKPFCTADRFRATVEVFGANGVTTFFYSAPTADPPIPDLQAR